MFQNNKSFLEMLMEYGNIVIVGKNNLVKYLFFLTFCETMILNAALQISKGR